MPFDGIREVAQSASAVHVRKRPPTGNAGLDRVCVRVRLCVCRRSTQPGAALSAVPALQKVPHVEGAAVRLQES